MVIILTLLTFVSTFLGGLVSLKYKDRLHLILGFTAGVLLAVVSFDVLPEIIELIGKTGIETWKPMLALVVGFLVFHILEKWLLIHHAHEDAYGDHKHPTVGVLSALALILHSFMDGFGIGLGFQLSQTAGILVATAVIAHDFSDGLNTVSLMLAHKNTDRKALTFLFFDAIAPLLGGLSTLLFKFPSSLLVIYLGFFAGFLLYIGAADILPEAHSKNSSIKTVLMTILGVGLIFAVSRLV
ncbi:MAG: ZIP family metal transporter [Candidatus Saccharibacteria bacterium]